MNKLDVLILAAGKGSRIKGTTPKLLLKIKNKTLIDHTINLARNIKPNKIYIIINSKLLFLKKRNKDCSFIVQKKLLGTGHATKLFLKYQKNKFNNLLILLADTPFISLGDISKIKKKLVRNDIVIFGFRSKKNMSYGLIQKDKNGNIKKIIEYKNASSYEKKINLCNSGIMAVNKKNIRNLLKIKKNKKLNEYLLTDIVEITKKLKGNVSSVISQKSKNNRGINTINEYLKAKNQ